MNESDEMVSDETADIIIRGLTLLLLVSSLPKVLYLISIYQWGIVGMIAVYVIFFSICFIIAYRKDEAVIIKITNIAKTIPKKKIGVCH
ncbi:hypothetical protein KAI56_02095 [Candidatus Parcubacteria bacterium]|nr:hypothetical protein [Candidatus Parcubacteria bacterium]